MGILPGGGLLLYEYMVYERHENSEFFWLRISLYT